MLAAVPTLMANHQAPSTTRATIFGHLPLIPLALWITPRPIEKPSRGIPPPSDLIAGFANHLVTQLRHSHDKSSTDLVMHAGWVTLLYVMVMP